MVSIPAGALGRQQQILEDLKKQNPEPALPKNRWPKNFLLVLFGIIGLYLLLTFLTRLFPYVDIPFHLAEATIYRYYQNPEFYFRDHYLVDYFFRPNIFHIAFTGSAVFPSVEFANKVYNAIYLVLFPVSVLALIWQLRGNVWFVLPSFLLIYNFNVSFGFVGFYFSIPLSLTILYLQLRTFQEKANWLRLALSFLFLFLFFVHTQTCLFCLLFYGLLNVFYFRRNPKQFLLTLIPMLPVISLIFYWWRQTQGESQTLGYLIYFYWSQYVSTLPERLAFFYLDNYFLLKGNWGIFAGCLVSFLLFSLAISGIILNRPALKGLLKDRQRAAFLLFMLVCFGCFFGLPKAIPGQAYIYHRYSVYALLSVIIFGSLLFPPRFNRSFSIGALLVVLIHFGMYAQKHWAFNQEMAGFNADFFPEAAKNKRLAGVMLRRDFRGYDEFLHVPDYYVVWKKAPAVVSFIDYRFGIIRRKAGFEVLPLYDEGYNFERDYDLPYQNMEYLLVNDTIPATARKKQMQDFRLLKRVNNWQLFERK